MVGPLPLEGKGEEGEYRTGHRVQSHEVVDHTVPPAKLPVSAIEQEHTQIYLKGVTRDGQDIKLNGYRIFCQISD